MLVLIGGAAALLADIAVAPAGGPIGFLLTLFAIMVGTATAVLAAVCARLSRSAQQAWLALLLGGYSLVVLPLASGIQQPTAYGAGEGVESAPAVVFAALRLLALAVVAAGVIGPAAQAHRAAQQARDELGARVAAAEQARQRLAAVSAYRDYEIRSGLSGLTGISELVRVAPAVSDRERLRAAVEGELTRLRGILEGASPWTCGREPGPE